MEKFDAAPIPFCRSVELHIRISRVRRTLPDILGQLAGLADNGRFQRYRHHEFICVSSADHIPFERRLVDGVSAVLCRLRRTGFAECRSDLYSGHMLPVQRLSRAVRGCGISDGSFILASQGLFVQTEKPGVKRKVSKEYAEI